MTIDIGIKIDLEKLIETRLLVQSTSGGGKSYTLRKLLEESNGKVQQIVIDLEGEFATLREKYDFVLFGEQGDYPVHIKYADKMARTLLELNISAIIDLYELKHHERIIFVRRFLDAMVNAPKELWHPCMVIVDEAHIFAPEKGSAESFSAVIDLCTRGRKRGFCAVLATQRLSKLHKDAAAECLNKIIGQTGLDIDRKRAGDELGFTSKDDVLSLRKLNQGEFYAFGPAISNEVKRIKVGEVKTSHPKTGARLTTIPPASNKIIKALSQIKDLPEEAEKELQTLNDYKTEVRSLRAQLGQSKRTQPVQKVDVSKYTEFISGLKKEKSDQETYYKNLLKELSSTVKIQQQKFDKIKDIVVAVKNIRIDIDSTKTFNAFDHPELIKSLPLSEKVTKEALKIFRPNENSDIKLREGARRMLGALVQWSPQGMTEGMMRSQAGLKKSGTYSAYKTDLKNAGFFEIKSDGLLYATDAGINWLGHDIPSPATTEDVLNVWKPKLRLGARRMLEVLIRYGGEYITDEQLLEEAGLSKSGTYSAYKTDLKTANLAVIDRGRIAANKETLFL